MCRVTLNPVVGSNVPSTSSISTAVKRHQRRRKTNMATSTGQNGQSVCASDVDLLLHPELLSQDFMRLILCEVSQCPKRIVGNVLHCENKRRILKC